MKKLLLTLVSLSFGFSSFSQTVNFDPYFGIKAGLNFPRYAYVNDDQNTSTETETTTNFNVSAFANIPFYRMISIEPGLSVQGKGGKYFINENAEVREDIWVVEVPVNILFNFGIGENNFYIGGGPYGSGIVAAEREFENDSKTGTQKLMVGDNYNDEIKRLDWGFNLETGFRFAAGYNFGVGYGMGVTNIRPTTTQATNLEQNHRVLRFTVGYSFN